MAQPKYPPIVSWYIDGVYCKNGGCNENLISVICPLVCEYLTGITYYVVTNNNYKKSILKFQHLGKCECRGESLTKRAAVGLIGNVLYHN